MVVAHTITIEQKFEATEGKILTSMLGAVKLAENKYRELATLSSTDP